jgi:hypothetical protein
MAAFFRKWGLALLMVAVIIVCVWIGLERRRQWKKDHVLVELKAIQTKRGWGYDILTNGHPYIHQDVIPDIKGSVWIQHQRGCVGCRTSRLRPAGEKPDPDDQYCRNEKDGHSFT